MAEYILLGISVVTSLSAVVVAVLTIRLSRDIDRRLDRLEGRV